MKGQKPKSNLPVQEIDNTATVTCWIPNTTHSSAVALAVGCGDHRSFDPRTIQFLLLANTYIGALAIIFCS